MQWLVPFLCLLPLLAGAGEQPGPGLGTVELEVPDRSAGERRKALSEGLDRVLVRLTGHARLSDLTALNPVRAGNPARWLAQYRYQEQKPGPGATPGPGGERTRLLLKARFDVSGLLKRLGELNAPVWDENRPAVLVWLVVQEPASGKIVARASDHRVRTFLEQAARRRGLPVVLPRMDQADRDTIRAADIRGRFDEPIRQASKRYDTPLVITAVLYSGSAPRLRWRLLDNGREEISGNLNVADMKTGVNRWVDRLTRHLVELYAVRGSDERLIRIRVQQLQRLQDWNRLHRHLLGLAGMHSVELRRLSGASATFRARFAGAPEKLERLAKLQPGLASCGDQGTLVAATAGSGSDTAPAEAVGPASGGPAGPGKRPGEPFELEFCWRGTETSG